MKYLLCFFTLLSTNAFNQDISFFEDDSRNFLPNEGAACRLVTSFRDFDQSSICKSKMISIYNCQEQLRENGVANSVDYHLTAMEISSAHAECINPTRKTIKVLKSVRLRRP